MAATVTRYAAVLVAMVLALAATAAGAHATLVLGSLTFEPDPPVPGAPTAVLLELVDPTQFPIEDAVVFIELTPEGTDETVVGDFTESAPGIYRSSVTLPNRGDYRLLMRDRTFRQEEARVTLPVTFGDDALEAVRFVFPPTATGGKRGIATWLIWLIGLPIVAGAVVTATVLTGGRKESSGNEEA